ncbi:MAG: hypothetical protein AAFY50_23180, partial [Cyanobacteria bacterium J06648_1]
MTHRELTAGAVSESVVTIKVGGSLPSATQTIVAENAQITADAIDTGDGGQVVIWSDSLTRFTGNISARGGENGGNGGLVEVSGRDLLVFTGTVDSRAALGESGSLLLDPKNIIISDEDTAIASIFSPAPEDERARIAGFGISVATVGENLLVGAPANVSGGENNAGQAFLFDRSGNALRIYDNPEPLQGGFFGFSVAAVGDDELLIGAPRNNVTVDDGVTFPEAGQVFLFNKAASEPLQTYSNPNPGAAFVSADIFTGAVPLADTNFGAAVAAVDSDRFLIGAPGQTVSQGNTEFRRSGQAFLLDRAGTNLQTFDNPNPASDGTGQAFVYDLDNPNLEPIQTYDNPSPSAGGGSFGTAVAILAPDGVLIGASENDFRGLTNSGEAFVAPEDNIISAADFTGAIAFDTDPGGTSIISPATIAAVASTGTDIVLQASNDILVRIDQEIITDNSSGNGGNIRLEAGRKVEIGADITSDNGNIEITANVPADSGVIAEFREPGSGTIAIAEGVNLDAGTGNISLNVAEGEGTRGNISLDRLTADNVALTTGEGTVEVAGSINATGDITLAGKEINLDGGADPANDDSESVFQLFNESTGEYFYTISTTERDDLLEDPNFVDRGVAFAAFGNDGEQRTPVYRFQNTATGITTFTPSESERQRLREDPNFQGLGIAFYAVSIIGEADTPPSEDPIAEAGTGSISGLVFSDRNRSGVRDSELVQGENPDLVFTLD